MQQLASEDKVCGRVLVVDDDASIRETLRLLLTSQGDEVLLASNGREGIALLEESLDLVVCDINMPNVNGIEVLQRLNRKTPNEER